MSTKSHNDSGSTSEATAEPTEESPKPHFVPKIPPPKTIRRYSDKDLPPVGTWVSVTWKKETVTGRVMISESTRIRIKEGAGFWEIPMREVSKIIAAPDPRDRKNEGPRKTRPVVIEIDD